MRIGFEAKRAFLNRTGLGNYSRNTISQLHQFYPEIESILFTPSRKNEIWTPPEGIKTIRPSGIMKITPALWRSRFMTREIIAQNPDIFHGLSHELPIGLEKTNIKRLVTIHDLIFLRYPEFYRKTDRLIYEKKFRYACRIANQVIAISNQTKSDLIRFFSVPEDKITIHYQSCSPGFYKQSGEAEKEECRIRYKLPNRFMLTVGNVEDRKNLLGLLKAMELRRIEFPLVVVGRPGTAWNEVQRLLQKHPARYPLVFVSGVKFEDLPILYQLADFSVYPSFFEGFGLPVLESMASGCPVITSAVSSMPEAAGEAAILVDPAEPESIASAIAELIDHPAKREILREKGYTQADLFREKHVAENLMKIYQNLLR